MSYYDAYSDKNSNLKPVTALVPMSANPLFLLKSPPQTSKAEATQIPTAPAPKPPKEAEPKTSPDKPTIGKTITYLVNPWVIALVAVGLALAFSGFLFIKYPGSQGKLSQPATLGSQDSTKKILDDVAKIMVLPADQTPTIATVTNVEKLRATQPFFNAAKNGDKLLIFADKAILYRPDENKIVDIGPVNRPSEATPEADTKPALLPTTEPVSPTSTPKPQATPTEATTSAR